MTRRDYDLLAACLGAAYAEDKNSARTVADIAARLTVELGLENPRFDRSKFSARIDYWRQQHGGDAAQE